MKILHALLVVLALFPGAASAAELGQARLSLVMGDVQIYTDDTQEWVPASINMPLIEGDRIWVPEGARTEIQLQGGVYVRLGSATSLDILAQREDAFQFYLNGGHAYINNRQGGVEQIQVDTPLASVRCYDNSLVMLDVAQDGATDVAVIKGYAAAESDRGTTRVEAGSALHLGSDLSAELSPLPPPDEWENWNRERDGELARGNRSYRYIPEELDDYSYDLDAYGRWVYVTDYGYCWTPRAVPAGWAPYRLGRWVWCGGNYVWISYEQWGWCPYHYGRWAFVVNVGWCWVPPRAGDIFWAPGYVGWVYTPTYVAWVPLAPGEIYYGRGYYGPRSVNITNVTIDRTVIRNYRNINVRNGYTVVNRTTFVTGRKEPARVRGNPFLAANVEAGPPVIKPTRATTVPVTRKIPSAKRPPERVRRVSVDEIRRERALVREEKGSAFKGGRPGAAMPVTKRNVPQSTIREQHPALPTAKPARTERPARRGERQPPAKAPEVIKGRPTPPAAQPSRQAPSAGKGTPEQQRAPARGESPRLTPRPERGAPREPRWQEPVPAAKPAASPVVPRRSGPASRPNVQRPATPAAAPAARPSEPHPAGPAGRGGERPEAPTQPRPQQLERR